MLRLDSSVMVPLIELLYEAGTLASDEEFGVWHLNLQDMWFMICNCYMRL